MPEPTTTRLQEWERITLKIVREGFYEKITTKEIRFIKLTYDRNNELIVSYCNAIQSDSFEVIQDMIKKNNETLSMIDKICTLIKLYSASMVWISIAEIINVRSHEERQRFINISINKISEIKNTIRNRLLETNPNVIELYNIFEKFYEVINEL
jgi:hypothetical protein